MFNWIHHLLNPHCPDCLEPCKSCETLKEQLERANYEREQLLQTILKLTGTVNEPVVQSTVNMAPVKPRHIPWRVRQQMLENESRASLQKQADRAKSIEKLEAELKIGEEDASKVS